MVSLLKSFYLAIVRDHGGLDLAPSCIAQDESLQPSRTSTKSMGLLLGQARLKLYSLMLHAGIEQFNE